MGDSTSLARRRPVTAKRVTITDVAARLGLAKGTVSRALNGYPDISEATRKRVTRTAANMGYSPLASAQSIKTGRSRAIGLILESDAHDQHSPFLTDFIAGISEATSREGWSLTVASARYGQDLRDTANRLIQQHKADGFIVPRTRVRDDRVTFLQDIRSPFIAYGRTGYGQSDAEPHAWYDFNGEDAMRNAVLRLYAQGHRRIAFVGHDPVYQFSQLRRDGYLRGLAECGLDVDRALICEGVVETRAGTRATQDLLRHVSPPTAIVFTTDEAALGSYDAAKTLGLSIGRDLSVISYDGVPRGEYADPPLSSFHVNNNHAGATLASLLIQQIRGDTSEILTRLDDATLIERGSNGPPRLTSKDLATKLASHTGQTSKGRTS